MATVRQTIQAGQPGNVLLCDLDHFKQINDTHGHATGDLVLTEVARILDRHGLAGRLGGDEFALWVAGRRCRARSAERIVDEVARAFPTPGRCGRASRSASRPRRRELPAALELADRALYGAKAGGRGCVRHADATDVGARTAVPAPSGAPLLVA